MKKTWLPTICVIRPDRSLRQNQLRDQYSGRHCRYKSQPEGLQQRFLQQKSSTSLSMQGAGWCCPRKWLWRAHGQPSLGERQIYSILHVPPLQRTAAETEVEFLVISADTKTGRCPVVTIAFDVGMLERNTFNWVTHEVPVYNFMVSSGDNTYFWFHKWVGEKHKTTHIKLIDLCIKAKIR